MTTSDKNPTCEDRIGTELDREIDILKDLWKWYTDGNYEEYHPEHEISLMDYGLDFSFVEPDTFNNQPIGYWRYQLSWGGPSDEFRFYDEGHSGTKVEYWFLDWFDGAHRTLRGTDKQLMLEIFDWFRPEGFNE